MKWMVVNGDALVVLQAMPTHSADSMVTDPPAGISFMGKKWDRPDGVGGKKTKRRGMKDETRKAQKAREKRNEPFARSGVPATPMAGDRQAFVNGMVPILRECLRVLKPGAHILVWTLPRTSHWTATAIEDAGFVVRDSISHIFGQGFPKSLDVCKAIGKAKGVKAIGEKAPSLGMANNPQWNELKRQLIMLPFHEWPKKIQKIAGPFLGWGTALKPAREDWILARKPLEMKSVAGNALKWRTGGINIDGCRVKSTENRTSVVRKPDREDRYRSRVYGSGNGLHVSKTVVTDPHEHGRFPSNVILSHSPDCVEIGTRKVKTGTAVRRNGKGGKFFGGINPKAKWVGPAQDSTHANKDGTETIPLYRCVAECPIKIMDKQSGIMPAKEGKHTVRKGRNFAMGTSGHKQGYPLFHPGAPEGGASRFFYCAKPAKAEKEKGLKNHPKKSAAELTGRKEGSAGLTMQHTDGSDKANPYAGTSGAEERANIHPTVKSVDLMRYLCRMVTPPGGVVLDPFSGSGSTGVAAIAEGMIFWGIEREPQYAEIAAARLKHAAKQSRRGFGIQFMQSKPKRAIRVRKAK